MIVEFFCEDCKYLENNGGMYEPAVFVCEYPDNKEVYKINWLRKWYKRIRKPKHINKHNDCMWFHAKNK